MERYANFEKTIGHMLAVNEQGISPNFFFREIKKINKIYLFFREFTEIATFMASDMPLSKLLNEEIPAGIFFTKIFFREIK